MTLESLTKAPRTKGRAGANHLCRHISSLGETIKNNPDDPQAYNMRGSVLAQAGKTAPIQRRGRLALRITAAASATPS
jgi:hypothetical protein